MRLHLSNLLASLQQELVLTQEEEEEVLNYFHQKSVSTFALKEYVHNLRSKNKRNYSNEAGERI